MGLGLGNSWARIYHSMAVSRTPILLGRRSRVKASFIDSLVLAKSFAELCFIPVRSGVISGTQGRVSEAGVTLGGSFTSISSFPSACHFFSLLAFYAINDFPPWSCNLSTMSSYLFSPRTPTPLAAKTIQGGKRRCLALTAVQRQVESTSTLRTRSRSGLLAAPLSTFSLRSAV